MTIEQTPLEGVVIITPQIFGDARGYFFEPYNAQKLQTVIGNFEFVQDNESRSSAGVLRGLHFQKPPFEQGKLVRVITGAVWDVVVDIRKNSATYGQHFGIELTGENKKQLWIPPGFAHGFLTLADHTIFAYKCTSFYAPEAEGSIRWNDPDLNIHWNIQSPIISEKDKVAPYFNQFISPF